MRRQRVEDGGLLGSLAVTQLVLGAPQQERPAVTVHHRIHFACRQLLQASLVSCSVSINAEISSLRVAAGMRFARGHAAKSSSPKRLQHRFVSG